MNNIILYRRILVRIIYPLTRHFKANINLNFITANPVDRPALKALDTHIVGGRDASIEEAPYQVSLQLTISGFGFCGGSIVDENWVVTAAHCTTSRPIEQVMIRAGSALINSGGSLHQAEFVIRHEKYTKDIFGIPENDVALIRVSEPFQFDQTRQPVPLFKQTQKTIAGQMSTVTGWGNMYEGGGSTDKLQIVNIPIVSKAECNEAYRSFGGIRNGQICAAVPEGGKDACQGDSGGPLTINGHLAGIVSWGYGCAQPGYPGVHTEVASYSNWILSKIASQ